MLFAPNIAKNVVKQYIILRRYDDNIPDYILGLREKIQKNPNKLTHNQQKIVLSLKQKLDEEANTPSLRPVPAYTNVQDQDDWTWNVPWMFV